LRNEGYTLDPIRILITPMPRLLQQIIERVLASQPDMIVAGHAKASESVATAVRRVRADLVILSDSRGGTGETPWQMLDENPRLKILAISSDGYRATRYELRRHQMVFDDISPELLINAVRAAVAA